MTHDDDRVLRLRRETYRGLLPGAPGSEGDALDSTRTV
jgi:hypothetical protein